MRHRRAHTGAIQLSPRLREGTATLLRERVAKMNVDNFVVRPQRQFVERYAEPEAWKSLGADDYGTLTDRVAGLPSQLSEEDEEAKRFDMLVLTSPAFDSSGAP